MVAKYTKYFFFIVLMMFGLFFNSELFQLHADSFQDAFYRADFAMDFSISNAKNDAVLEDFVSAGERYNVNFFMTDFELNGANKKKIKIFATKGAMKALKSDGIHSGSFDSLLMGTTDIEVNPIKRIKRITSYESCYFTDGTKQLAAMRKFKADLIDKYGGSFPRQYGSPNETFFNFAALWGLLIVLFLLISSYSIISEKKEITVSVILGADPVFTLRKRMLIDATFFIGTFIFCRFFMSRSIYVGFMKFETDMIFFAMLLLNCLTISKLGKINFRKDLGRSKDGGGVLKTNYILIFFITVFSSIVLAGNISVIRTGLNFCAQENFFKRHQNHAFYNLSYKESEKQGANNDEKEVKMNREFYKLNFKKSIQFAYCSNEFEASYPTIIVNRYALSEILRENPALPQKVSHDEDKIYVYFPAAVSSNSPEFESSIEMNPENLHREAMRERMHAVRYNTHVDVVGFSYEDEKLHSILSSDPIIIYDSAIPMMRNEENFSLNASGLLLQVTDDVYMDFIEKHGLESQITNKINIWSWYQSEKMKMARDIRLAATLALLVSIMEMFYIFGTVKIEYRVNATEHALKKILGVSLWLRNGKIFCVIAIASILGTFSSLLLNKILKLEQDVFSLVTGGGLLIALEILITLLNIVHVERARMTSILKGKTL